MTCPKMAKLFFLQQMKTLLVRFLQCRALYYNAVIIVVILREKKTADICWPTQ